ncbi:hypothetical protein PVAND_016649 [Polypedilum vanderplanki]|uniref:Tubulin-tyrosine ligase family protein n=1 Tax=Polypedilum vanderplanki TaxID=319348 RepID=A0A9J6BG79_POLVA|nr:hypothetical protein PVAND_016649 [Polypedilum vanderplanki]
MIKTENSTNFLDFPSEVLIEIFKLTEDDKDLLLTCKRFYEIISEMIEKNFCLFVDYNKSMINPHFNFDDFINSSSSISIKNDVNQNSSTIENFNEKFNYFILNFGHKIKKFEFPDEIENFTKKYLPKMTNLEEIKTCVGISLESENIEKFSIPIKKLSLYWEKELEELKIFTFDELEIDLQYAGVSQEDFNDFLKNYKNLKRLKIYHMYEYDLTESFKELSLESLDLEIYCELEMIENYLKYQTQLKELSLLYISKEIFLMICENFKNLENLSIPTFEENVMENLSKLPALKSLKFNEELKKFQFDEILVKLKIEKLENLEIQIFFVPSAKDFENLAKSYENLKSLKINFSKEIHLKVVSKIFESFNNLESLELHMESNLNFNENEESKFYEQIHINKNLKNLFFNPNNLKVQNLISNFILNFPNLESIDFGKNVNINENFEQILTGFSEIKKIENPFVSELNQTNFEKFLELGKNLEEFKVDINLFKNPNEALKNCSFSFEDQNILKVMRDDKKKMKFTLENYFQWKAIRIAIESKRNLKHLKIHPSYGSIIYEKALCEALKEICKNVKTLTILKHFDKKNFINFLKILPNCEELILEDFLFIDNFDENYLIENEKIQSFSPKPETEKSQPPPIFETFTNRNEIIIWTATPISTSDRSVFNGIEKVSKNLNHRVTERNDDGSNFDIMWTHEYFFDKFVDKFRTMKLKDHQMINHIPSITFLTNKLHLSISATSRFIPSSFNFPSLKNEFLYYAKVFPKSKFIVKNMDQGGIEVVPFEKVNINLGTWRFLQAYILPRLIYGHAFDLGVYVLITSMDPLRIYRWKQDILLRFCSEKYLPFDYDIQEKFNCGYNYKNIWEIPQLTNRLESSNMEIIKNALNPTNPSDLEKKIDEAISVIALEKNKISNKYSTLYVNRTNNKLKHFFELVRFDFIVDNDFDVYLIEINMSPEMNFDDEESDRNEKMHQGLLKDTLKIIGAENYEDYVKTRTSSFNLAHKSQIDLNHCKNCEKSCEAENCNLCLNCMSIDEQEFIFQAHNENQRKGNFKRLLPSKSYMSKESQNFMTDKTKKLSEWMNLKCNEDINWC